MVSDEWPAVKVSRFDGESERDYGRRSSRIVEIMTGFRKGKFRGEIAERFEQELTMLQEPDQRISLALAS